MTGEMERKRIIEIEIEWEREREREREREMWIIMLKERRTSEKWEKSDKNGDIRREMRDVEDS